MALLGRNSGCKFVVANIGGHKFCFYPLLQQGSLCNCLVAEGYWITLYNTQIGPFIVKDAPF